METWELEAGNAPRTVWEIAYSSLMKEGRESLRNDDDLKALGLTINELTNAVAEAIAQKEGIEDLHASLLEATVKRIHYVKKSKKSISTAELHKAVGKLRIGEIKRRAEIIVSSLAPDLDAEIAVRSVDSHTRRDKAESTSKSLDDLADELAALALAAVDRKAGNNEKQPTPPGINPAQEPHLGEAATVVFIRAVARVIETKSMDSIALGVKNRLRELQAIFRDPKTLQEQLATASLLGHDDTVRLRVDASTRKHHLFGLREPKSHAYLAAALHMLAAQAGRKNIATASRDLAAASATACEAEARQAILTAIETEAQNRHTAKLPPREYQPVVNRLDSLRSLASAGILTSETEIPTILGVLDKDPLGEPTASSLLLQVFPLREENSVPWSSPSWRSAGESIRGMLNAEHKKLSSYPTFSPREFEDTAVEIVLIGVKNFINLLLRAEGVRSGYANRNRTYEHLSAKELSNTLATRITGKDSIRIFNELAMLLRTRSHNPGTAPLEADKANPPRSTAGTPLPVNDVPQALAILAPHDLRQLLLEVASLTPTEESLSPAARRLLTPDPRSRLDPDEAIKIATAGAARSRAAAAACIQFLDWAQHENEPIPLESAFAGFYKEMSDLDGGVPKFNPAEVIELLSDALTLLADNEKGTA